LARYQAICVSAIRQSRQLYLPQIDPPAELVKFLAAPHAGVRILADCGPQTPPLRLMAGPPAAEDVTVLIGPEGGWSPEEIAQARQREFQPARLGSSTLRVETAAIAITAAIGALYDVFQSAPPCAATDHHPSEGG
jgi:16S rRNA (uracil1498-N3)-methyltransferase